MKFNDLYTVIFIIHSESSDDMNLFVILNDPARKQRKEGENTTSYHHFSTKL